MSSSRILPRSFIPSSLTKLTVGASLMYYMDPQQGRRRRALVRDRLSSLTRYTQADIETAGRDLNNRMQGLFAELSSRFSNEEVSDTVLSERVRSKLGRHVSNTHAIEVQVTDGRVVLKGPIPTWEALTLVGAVKRMRGVKSVDNQLEQHDDVTNIPALQGAKERQPAPGMMDFFQSQRSPATRLVVGSIIGYGLIRTIPRISLNSLTFLAAGTSLMAPSLIEGTPGQHSIEKQQQREAQEKSRAAQVAEKGKAEERKQMPEREAEQPTPGIRH